MRFLITLLLIFVTSICYSSSPSSDSISFTQVNTKLDSISVVTSIPRDNILPLIIEKTKASGMVPFIISGIFFLISLILIIIYKTTTHSGDKTIALSVLIIFMIVIGVVFLVTGFSLGHYSKIVCSEYWAMKELLDMKL